MSTAPLTLILQAVRYVRSQTAPVTTAQVAHDARTTTGKAAAALTIARQRGYVTGHRGTWEPGPVEPGTGADALQAAARRHQGQRARKPKRRAA